MKTETIRQKVFIPATPAQVYEAFIDEKKHSKFTGDKATINPTVGGEFTAGNGYISGKNIELELGKRIVQEWVTSEWPEGYAPSRMELTFRKSKSGTELSMVHSSVPAEQAADISQGWVDFYWEPLKKYFKK